MRKVDTFEEDVIVSEAQQSLPSSTFIASEAKQSPADNDKIATPISWARNDVTFYKELRKMICHPRISSCHPREGGDPERLRLDSLLRGDAKKGSRNDNRTSDGIRLPRSLTLPRNDDCVTEEDVIASEAKQSRPKIKGYYPLSLILCLILFCASPLEAQSLSLDLGNGGKSIGGSLVQILLMMTVLSLAPSILIMVTSFTRIVVVLSFLRNAIGLQQSPPSTVLASLALFLTAFIMGPTLEKAYEEGIAPFVREEIDFEKSFEKTTAPLKVFMHNHVREDDLNLFNSISEGKNIEKVEDTPLKILVPAFIISELRRAFEIGFLIFIPFIIIDLIVASVLMSMGMMMVPPMMVSLPFKIVFFVLIDGWHLIVGSLMQSFTTG